MKTFPNIWNYILGTFPNVFAKIASGSGAKDGTEWRKTAVDELLLGWIQKLLVFVGQTPNGTPETSTDSQIFDAMREAFSTPEKQTVSISGLVTLGKTNHLIEFDASGGNIAPDLPDGDFIGQKVGVYTTGSGRSTISGTGLYVNDVIQTSNTGILLITWNGIGWEAVNQVSADYVSGDFVIEKYSSGRMVIEITSTKTNGITGEQTFVFPDAFTVTPVLKAGQQSGGATTWMFANSTTNTSFGMIAFNNGGATASGRTFGASAKGEY